jgi:predicted ATPase
MQPDQSQRAPTPTAGNATADLSAFDLQVRDALVHLYDLPYLQTHPLARFFRANRSDSHTPTAARALQRCLLEVIDALHAPTAGSAVREQRGHRLLHLRYVEGMTAEQVWAQLGISKTEYYREHRRALDALASLLCARWGIPETDAATLVGLAVATTAAAGAGEPRASTRAAVASELTAVAADDLARHNLPAAITSFVGRDVETAEVRRLLAGHRLLTLTGVGGSGKTRLALEVAATLPEEYPNGVWLVELAALADPGLVASAVAAVLRVQQQPDEALVETLTRVLRRKMVLLVLDNCEHLLDACAGLAETLLRACPALRILATSRESLGITGEVSYRVPSLSLPSPDEAGALDLGQLSRFDAVVLFVDRASLARPGFGLTVENAPVVARICARLDGLPLAIELATARLRVFSLQQVAERLDDLFRLLTGGSRTVLPRQQTLRAAIDWSYGLLTASERRVLRRLAVFAGGFALEAAEAVCAEAEDDGPAGEVEDTLARLVDRSLIEVDDHSGRDDGAALYRLLETIRQYAGERLVEAGEAVATRDRHLAWYVRLAEEAEPALRSDRMIVWLRRLATEHDNVRCAVQWAIELGHAESGLRLIGALSDFWRERGNYAEARVKVEALLALPGAAGASIARGLALRTAGLVAYMLGDDVATEVYLTESLAIGQAFDDTRLIVDSFLWHGRSNLRQGAHERAREQGHEALALARERGDRWSVAIMLFFLADVALELAEWQEARSLATEMLAIGRATANEFLVLIALNLLGRTAHGEGRYAEAESFFALDQAEASRDHGRRGVAWQVYWLGRTAFEQSDIVLAGTRYAECLAILRDLGDRQRLVIALEAFAGLAARVGEPWHALRLAGAAAALRGAAGWKIAPVDQADLDRWLAPARQALDPDASAAAWAEGEVMSLDEATANALDETTVAATRS